MIQFCFKLGQHITVAVLCVALFSCHLGYCAQISESEAAEMVKLSIRETFGDDESRFLNCQRDIHLESTFSDFLSESTNKIPFIFRVLLYGEEVKGDIVRVHAPYPIPRDFIVAVSDTGKIFRISVTISTQKEIEDFVLHYGVNLKNKENARAFLLFYLSLNPQRFDPSIFESMLDSVEEVYDRAQAKFRAESDDKVWESYFISWKQRHSNDINKLDFGLNITETKQGQFSASFYTLSEIDPNNLEYGPAVLRCTLKLSSKGIVRDLQFHSVWRKWYKWLWPF